MKLTVQQSQLSGIITVPGSKSHSIRALAVASMAGGRSFIRAPLASEDTISGMHAARAFGAEVKIENDDLWIVDGIAGGIQNNGEAIDLGNSGTSLRIFAALAALGDAKITFDGDASLRTRVMAPVLDALRTLGARIESTDGKCPLSIQGPIHAGEVSVCATSSQFLTALLFAAPLIPHGETIITLTELNEKPYVEITLDWLRAQGIRFECTPDLMHFRIPGGQCYTPFDRVIPADFSTATFPLAASLITRSPLAIRNLDFSDAQGDKAVFDYAVRMGATITRDNELTHIIPPKKPLQALDPLDLNDTPDALPAMAALACFCEGTTRIVNTPQARIKETDRIAAMTLELRKMGALIEETPDGMIITPPVNGLRGAVVHGHADHRIVMALAIAGLGAEGETVIDTAEAAAVTYPGFVTDFSAAGARFFCN